MKNLIREVDQDTRSNPSSFYDPNSYYFLILLFDNRKDHIFKFYYHS